MDNCQKQEAPGDFKKKEFWVQIKIWENQQIRKEGNQWGKYVLVADWLGMTAFN